ncbi:4-galactosyl-N-acetylglucosaminide 3-alpha-L-fucosyltransferase 9-like [Centroberyx gerrardi]|uniref:4-galactosyl-N-acetylglucosaminide 3-alpha-L-fucosyltransferase 9-like n=1 Tax=Centroberyx gerrardi TaxID=166262 RepID=UPI003AAFE5FB
MLSTPTFGVLRVIFTVFLILGGFMILFLMYYKSSPSPKCHPPPTQQPNKPIVLLWFWPENKRFDFGDCKKLLNIDSCHLTDDRSLYSKAQAVLIFHRAIEDDLSNLPTSPRPGFQRWIWFNMGSPTHTRKIPGIQGLFNLTLSYRKDADIQVRWRLTVKKRTDEHFVLPKKERLLCWIVGNSDPQKGSGRRYSYYRQLVKHIKVDVFSHSSARFFKYEDYFLTISSCKFYLSFENSIHKDYITEKLNGPLAVGTVPIVLGPPRHNYEDFVPGDSFIHVNDFLDAQTLAKFLLRLDKDNETYIRYFDWRNNYSARRHLTGEKHAFTHAVCQACAHVGSNKEYRVMPNVYKWFFG